MYWPFRCLVAILLTISASRSKPYHGRCPIFTARGSSTSSARTSDRSCCSTVSVWRNWIFKPGSFPANSATHHAVGFLDRLGPQNKLPLARRRVAIATVCLAPKIIAAAAGRPQFKRLRSVLMISRRELAYPSMIRRTSSEVASLGGGLSSSGRGLSGRFIPRPSVQSKRRPLS